ncbi:MAG: cobalamin B12-binding domain-containing protein [Acidobacteria bacterium]|nr:cobalamin B12-binding domain-containing protein [Acidobacteriota bacterium]
MSVPPRRILLTSVFKPFAVDDEFGSRAINPVELYHNQVTREQGPFSLRMFHRTWSLMFLRENISTPCTLLDFPTRERFIRELRTCEYDMVGISSIVVNVGKVREMCRLVRLHSPHSTIVVGGHVTSIPGIERLIDADHIVRGEGVRWLRAFLGEDPEAPIRHPLIPSSFGFRVMGVPVNENRRSRSATIVPSVGCPMGCNFCTTSAFFGGKGKFVNFYDRGDELFRVMCDAERRLATRSFFMMDENFLLHKRRALELLACMQEHGKPWSMYVFSSANAVRQYDIRQLVELGVEWVWLGLESSRTSYVKLAGADTLALTRELQGHGICVHGSTIVGMEHHTPDNIWDDLDRAIAHDTVFHQFMLYTPMPGTPLHRQVAAEGRLLEGIDPADIHGQYQFNFRHPAISREQSKVLLDAAFRADYERNGPSLYRLMRTMFDRYRRYGADADPRVRARVERAARQLRGSYMAALWAMERCLQSTNRAVSDRIRELREEMGREFGARSRLSGAALGRLLAWAAEREAAAFPAGRPLEPRTFVERTNWA